MENGECNLTYVVARTSLRVGFNEGFLVGFFLGTAVFLKGAFVGFNDGTKDDFRVDCAGRERVSDSV